MHLSIIVLQIVLVSKCIDLFVALLDVLPRVTVALIHISEVLRPNESRDDGIISEHFIMPKDWEVAIHDV